LREENPKLANILSQVKVIYLDNPPLKGRNVEDNKLTRMESQKRLLTHLASCQGNYLPGNIDDLDERINEYKTDEQKLKSKMAELDKERKEQAEKFRKEMLEIKEQHIKDAKETREKFEKDLNKVKTEGEESLRKVVDELEKKAKKEKEKQEQKNIKRQQR